MPEDALTQINFSVDHFIARVRATAAHDIAILFKMAVPVIQEAIPVRFGLQLAIVVGVAAIPVASVYLLRGALGTSGG